MKNKKILFEIVLIPLCIVYLIFILLNNHEITSLVICIVFTIITSLVFIIKYIREVYIYESKYNIYKVLFSIYNIFLLILIILKLVFDNSIFNLLFIIFVAGLLLYLLYYFIKHFIKIIKNSEKLYKNIISSFMSLVSFCIILSTLIITL